MILRTFPWARYILLVLAIACCSAVTAQKDSTDMKDPVYAKEWAEIDSLDKQRLVRSALEKVQALKQKAQQEGKDLQVIKALTYESKYRVELSEEGILVAIRLFDAAIADAELPNKAILESTQASLFATYLEQNYWQINDRTASVQEEEQAIETWSADRLQKHTFDLYLQSISYPTLKNYLTKDFAPIIEKGSEWTIGLRPNLLDVLGHKALDYFRNTRSFLTEPAYAFVMRDPAQFGAAADFVQLKLESQDELSRKLRVLEIFQQLMEEKLAANNVPALIDLDLKRLLFVKENSVLEDKNSLYKKALDALAEQYEYQKGADLIYLNLAEWHQQEARQYAPLQGNDFKWDNKKAIEYCQSIIDKFPDSYSAGRAKVLMSNIKKAHLGIQIEEIVPSDAAILAKITYKNQKQAYLKIVKTSFETEEKIDQLYGKDVIDSLNNLEVVRKWTLSLPDEEDYNMHSIETKINALPLGRYALIISSTADLDQDTNNRKNYDYFYFSVSDMAFFSRMDENNLTQFVLMDRNTGAPLKGVEVSFHQRDYDYKTQTYVLKKLSSGQTNEMGFITMLGKRKSFVAEFKNGDDRVFFKNGYYNGNRSRQARTVQQTSLFLDRSIYRPGQTVYFKGIFLEKNVEDQNARVMANKKIELIFRDVNYQEIGKQTFRTNEFGTFNGSFETPVGGLTGMMTIESDRRNLARFRVEEYKRPRFEVNINPLEGDYVVNQEVKVSGNAKTLAGSAVDGAELKYRITRFDMQPYPWLRSSFFRSYGYRSNVEIAYGTLQTDEEGNFEIPFTALPNPNIPEDQNPRFRYQVQVEVTDITGETRSSSQSVIVGYTGMQLRAQLPQRVDKAEQNLELNLITENHNNQSLGARGKMQIFRLNSPDQVLIKRYWQRPDLLSMSEEEFKKDFPHYAYKNEDQPQAWTRAELQLEQDFDTENSQSAPLDFSNWEVGHYELYLSSEDAQGKLIEYKQQFSLIDSEEELVPKNTSLVRMLNKNTFEPEEKAQLSLGTAYEQLNLLVEVERNGQLLESNWIQLDQWLQIEKLVQEYDRGNFNFHISAVKNSRAVIQTQTIVVPFSNKELQFEYATFRDKLRPGAEEEWIIKVLGPKKEKVSAEIVASMYDASLDAFTPHNWRLSLYNNNNSRRRTWRTQFFSSKSSEVNTYGNYYRDGFNDRNYPNLNWMIKTILYNGQYMADQMAPMAYSANTRSAEKSAAPPPPPPPPGALQEVASEASMELDSSESVTSYDEPTEEGSEPAPIQIRTNLEETVFFKPELYTDDEGNVLIKFKMNEALTRWKFMALAHTKDLKVGLTQKEIVTQKELMVLPNAPRFVREGDAFEFTAKVSNLTEGTLTGNAQLELLDAATNKKVNDLLGLSASEINFTAEAGQSARLAWNINIPEGQLSSLTYRVIAQSGPFSDGEENMMPVLSNRMLVTESMPLSVRAGETKTFDFAAFRKSSQSPSAKAHNFKLEYTSNPAWLAVQSMPYLMEYEHECSEQLFNRMYANTLATKMVNSNPRIKEVFESWKNTPAMKSNLSKNQALKAVLLEETPWVMDALSEEQQKKQIALLFDLDRMAQEQSADLNKLSAQQLNSGGFPWFAGGRENWYITSYIIAGIGHLKQLNAYEAFESYRGGDMLQSAISYSDMELARYYQRMLQLAEEEKINLDDNHLTSNIIQYLYARSFFLGTPIVDKVAAQAIEYFKNQTKVYWTKQNLQQQAQIGLIAKRWEIPQLQNAVVSSLRERALYSEEQGMYWKYNTGWFWYQAPIETHALMIELFDAVDDQKSVDELKIWLLKNKQTNSWSTTKATAEAIYALLGTGGGESLLGESEMVDIQFPNLKKKAYKSKLTEATANAEQGTGYFESKWSPEEISSKLAKIKVKNTNKVVSWGAAYWQYFEDLDKIQSFKDTPLKLSKELYKSVATDRGPKLEKITADALLKAGDKLIVKINLRVDRDMEFVHLKDMRAAGLEPLNVLSGYRWQDGLGYYESTKDIATHFFFDYLPKGNYVFEYPLSVQLNGTFSNGISSIQSMYAPEFAAHSEGMILKVGE